MGTAVGVSIRRHGTLEWSFIKAVREVMEEEGTEQCSGLVCVF